MTEEQERRLYKRFTIVYWLFVVAIVLFLISLFVRQEPQVNNFVGQRGETGMQGPKGDPGVTVQGLRGVPGEPGKTVITENTTVVERPGEQGPQGEAGEPGREVEIQKNPDTGDVEWRYKGDRLWQTLIELCDLKICEAENGLGTN